MNRRHVTTLSLILTTYLVAAGAFTAWTVHGARETAIRALDERLLVGAKGLKHMLADDFHDRATGPDSVSLEEIERNRIAMSSYAEETGFVFVYTLTAADGRFYFSAPTVTPEELREKESWYFHPYDDIPEAFVDAFHTGRTAWSTYQDQWGRFRSVAVPEASPGGRRYLACADYPIEAVERSVLRSSVGRSLAAAAFILFAFPLAVFVRSLAREHSRELTEANNDLISKQNLLQGLAAENARLAAAIDSAAELVVTTDSTLAITYANPAFHHVAGFSPEELLGKDLRILAATTSLSGDAYSHWQGLEPGQSWSGQFSAVARDGTTLDIEATVAPICDAHQCRAGLVLVGRDVSEQLGLERQFRQAQKMEALGILAGGIAHDFNNLLTPVVGYADLIKQMGIDDEVVLDSVEQILIAARRASDLVGQILSFSRQHESGPRPLDPSAVTREALRLARASIPSTIKIETAIAADVGAISGDPVHLNQILMNLLTNAFHAMREGGGTITVGLERLETGHPSLDRFPELLPGPHVRLTVADTGHGMDGDTLDKIFLPFYSTKKTGEGTGLGLSTVHGIVKRSRGAIGVTSEIGEGTTFEILFPAIGLSAESAEESGPYTLTGSGRILVVDDEPAVAAFVTRALELGGYRVTTETSSLQALQCFRSSPDRYALVVTDDTMPDLTGPGLAAEIRRIRPHQPVLLMTGYRRSARPDHGDSEIDGVVHKPFSTRELAKAVHQCLGPGA